LTLKTYGVAKGLATKIHRPGAAEAKNESKVDKDKTSSSFNDEEIYWIKGPMGRGL